MKITRKQLKRIIAENLGLTRIDESTGTGPVKDQIIKLVKNNIDSQDTVDIISNVLSAIEAMEGKELIELIDSRVGKKLVSLLGLTSMSSLIGTAATVFGVFVFASGLFFTLPNMITRTIDALNTVPGKLRSLKDILGRPVNPEDVSNDKKLDVYGEISKNMGIKKITRDDMMLFLALGIGMTGTKDSEGNIINSNPVEALGNDDIISEKFHQEVLSKYYKLRESSTPDVIKKNMFQNIYTGLKKSLKDDRAVFELQVKDLIEIIGHVVL